MLNSDSRFSPAMMAVRESVLIRALAACAGVYFEFNVSKDCMLGKPVRIIEGEVVIGHRDRSLDTVSTYTETINYLGQKLNPIEQPAYFAFFNRSNLFDCFERGDCHIVHVYTSPGLTGTPETIEHHIHLYRDTDTGDLLGISYMKDLQHIVELVERERQALLKAEMASIDTPTGLPNRNRCEELLSAPLPSGVSACIMADLNNLKDVNDAFGHAAGDSMILAFSRVLRHAVPQPHFVGRYGGDEFLIVAYNLADRAEAEAILRKIGETVEHYNSLAAGLKLSFAVGLACSCDTAEPNMRKLFRCADRDMYGDKFSQKGTALPDTKAVLPDDADYFYPIS